MHSRRIPGTDRFFSSWKAEEAGEFPIVLVVEQTESGCRLRWDALEQQIEGRLAQFSRSPAESGGHFYVQLEWIGPDTAAGGALAVLVSSPFDGPDTCAFRAVIDERGGVAEQWRQLLAITSPRETIARLQWTADGGTPVAALEPIGSGPWESPRSAVAAVHATESNPPPGSR